MIGSDEQLLKFGSQLEQQLVPGEDCDLSQSEVLIQSGMLDKDYYAAVMDYDMAVLHGIVKIASKMGISTIQSYQGAQIFEAIGISREVVDKYFTNTVSRVGGITLEDIASDVDTLHSSAFDPLGLDVDLTLDSVGSHKSRSGQEEHLYNPLTIHLLQEAARTGSYDTFKEYTAEVDRDDKTYHLRSLMDFKFPEDGGIPLEQVESVESICLLYTSRRTSLRDTVFIQKRYFPGWQRN